MQTGARVLVVDDEVAILNLLRDFLEADGYVVATAENAEAALAQIAAKLPDCVLIDVMMPGGDGFELCRTIRASSDLPVLFLSARETDVDKLRGLRLGADDYITKSAKPDEVVARVAAVLRRTRGRPEPGGGLNGRVLDYGKLAIDLGAHEVRIGGEPCELPPREFDLLVLLAEHPRQVFSNEQLVDRLWGGFGSRSTVAVHVRRVREKIEANPNEPRYLINVRGVGYRFEPQG
jgi:DNA-binding response OmpR family regulator